MLKETEEFATSVVPSEKVHIVTDENALGSLASEWDALVSRSSGTIFQTFDWQYLWWKHFASKPQHHLLVVLFRENGRLIGIAPLFLQSYTIMGFRIFRQLKLLGSGLRSEKSPVLSLERDGPADYLDVIAERGSEQKVATSLSSFLKNNGYLWDEIEFQNLPEDGILLNYVLPRLSAFDLEIFKKETDVCPKVLLPDSLDKYLSSLRIKVRRNLRHSYRAYFENPEYDVGDFGQKGNVDGALQSLSMLHQKRWNAIGYPGLFSDYRFESLQRDLVKALGKKGKVWIKVLRHQGKPIAARLGFKHNGQVCDYLSGFELTRRSGSPNYSGAGMALILSVVKESIESKCGVFDLARGDEAYKSDLTSTVTRNYRVSVRPKRDHGRRYFTYKMSSGRYSLVSRINCESTIFSMIAKERGGLLAVPSYIQNLIGRLSGGSASLSVRSTIKGLRLRSGDKLKKKVHP